MQTQTSIPAKSEPLLYRVPELARVLAISRAAVWNLISSGKIRAVRIRGSVRIARDEAERIAREGIGR